MNNTSLDETEAITVRNPIKMCESTGGEQVMKTLDVQTITTSASLTESKAGEFSCYTSTRMMETSQVMQPCILP